MKKIFISLLSVFILSAVFYNVTPVQASGGIIVATVNINNAKIVSQKDRNFVISFNISNKTGVQPQIKYSIRLTKFSAKKDILIDEKASDEALSIGENTSISEVVGYDIPSAVPAGTYRLWIDSKNGNGLPLGIAYLGEVKITENTASTIQIVPDSCFLIVNKTQHPAGQSVAINPVDTLTVKCKVLSNFSTSTMVIPNFVTRDHTAFGDIASTTGGTRESITIKKGINDITLALPKGLKSQDYNLALSLVSGNIISNTISFNYTIAGQNGTIKNVVFDKTIYEVGDTASLQIFSTQTSTGTIVVSVSNDVGLECAIPITKEVSSFSVTNLLIPITKDCVNPKANVILSIGDKVLDTNAFQVKTPDYMKTSTDMTGVIVAIIVLLILLLILVILIYKKKSHVVKTFIIVFLFSFGVFGCTNATTVTHVVSSFNSTSRLEQSCNTACANYDDGNGNSYTCQYIGTDSNGNNGFINKYGLNHALSAWGYTAGGCGSTGQKTDNSSWGSNCSCVTSVTPVAAAAPAASASITSFTAYPNPVHYGGSTVVSWESTNNENCSIQRAPLASNQPYSGLQYNDSWTFYNIIEPTGFQLNCGGAISTLIVSVLPPAPTANLTRTPSGTIPHNGNATLTWTSTDSTSCTLYKGIDSQGLVSPVSGGSISTGALTSDTTYKLSCTGDGGTIDANLSVPVYSCHPSEPPLCNGGTISPVTDPTTGCTTYTCSLNLVTPTVTISAATTTLSSGESTDISWSSTGVDSCVITKKDTVISNEISGSVSSGPLDYSYMFTAKCYNDDVLATSSQIAVFVYQPIAMDLVVDPTSVFFGNSTQISGSTGGADYCSLTKNGNFLSEHTSSFSPIIPYPLASSMDGIGGTPYLNEGWISETVVPDVTTDFVMECRNAATSSTITKTVTVTQPNAPEFTFSAASTSVPYGDSTILSWAVTGDISGSDGGCTLSGKKDGTEVWSNDVTSATTSSGSITATTTFSLSCKGPGGSTDPKTVIVSALPISQQTPSVTLHSPIGDGILFGASTTISLTSNDVDFCTTTVKMGDVAEEIFSTSTSVSKSSGVLTATTTFFATCTNVCAPAVASEPEPNEVMYDGGTATYTVPDGVHSIKVKAWGAGAYGTDGSASHVGCGGGGGGYSEQTFDVTPGTNYDVVVGDEGSVHKSSFGTLISANGASGTQGGVGITQNGFPGNCITGSGGAAGGYDGGSGGAPGVQYGFGGYAGIAGVGGAPGGGGGGGSPNGGWWQIGYGGSGHQGRIIVSHDPITTGGGLVCSGPIATSSLTIKVYPSAFAEIKLNASSTSITSGSSTTISWSSTNSNFCTTTKKMGTSPSEIFATTTSGFKNSGVLTSNTTFFATCSKNGGGFASSSPLVVNVGSGHVVTHGGGGGSIIIEPSGFDWVCDDLTSVGSVTKNGVVVTSGSSSSGTLIDENMAEGDVIGLSCGGKLADQITVPKPVIPTITSTCVATQEDENMYKDRNTVWTAVLSPESAVILSSIKTQWSGTDVATTTRSGNILNKTYTSTGPKVIRAVTTGRLKGVDKTAFTTTCSNIVIMDLSPTIEHEI